MISPAVTKPPADHGLGDEVLNAELINREPIVSRSPI